MEGGSYELPLHLATERGDTEAVRLMLSHVECDVNAVDEASEHTALHIACKNGFIAIAKLLLDRGASQKCGRSYGESGYMALHVAAMGGSPGTVKLLVKRGADVDSVAHGRTSLHLACKFGRLGAAIILLNSGSDVKKVTEDSLGCTALHYAAQSGKEDIVKLLLCRKADIYSLDKYGRSAIHYAWENQHSEIGDLLLRIAEGFRSSCGVPRAVREGVVKLLLNCEDDVNVRDGEGLTALHWACRGKSPKVAECLLKSGADVNAATVTEFTPLHFAVDDENSWLQDSGIQIDLVELLLQYGADVNAKSEGGRTPVTDFLHFYDDCDDGTIAEIFAKHVAKMQAFNLPVEEGNLQALSGHGLIRDFFAACGTEIRKLRGRRIAGSTATFLDVLGKGVVRLADYMANESIRNAFMSGEYEREFPIYAENLRKQFVLGIERLVLLRKCDAVLNRSNCRFMPYVGMRQIKRCLTNDDLQSILNSKTTIEP